MTARAANAAPVKADFVSVEGELGKVAFDCGFGSRDPELQWARGDYAIPRISATECIEAQCPDIAASDVTVPDLPRRIPLLRGALMLNRRFDMFPKSLWGFFNGEQLACGLRNSIQVGQERAT
jgi:hypothetical protein